MSPTGATSPLRHGTQAKKGVISLDAAIEVPTLPGHRLHNARIRARGFHSPSHNLSSSDARPSLDPGRRPALSTSRSRNHSLNFELSSRSFGSWGSRNPSRQEDTAPPKADASSTERSRVEKHSTSLRQADGPGFSSSAADEASQTSAQERPPRSAGVVAQVALVPEKAPDASSSPRRVQRPFEPFPDRGSRPSSAHQVRAIAVPVSIVPDEKKKQSMPMCRPRAGPLLVASAGPNPLSSARSSSQGVASVHTALLRGLRSPQDSFPPKQPPPPQPRPRAHVSPRRSQASPSPLRVASGPGPGRRDPHASTAHDDDGVQRGMSRHAPSAQGSGAPAGGGERSGDLTGGASEVHVGRLRDDWGRTGQSGENQTPRSPAVDALGASEVSVLTAETSSASWRDARSPLRAAGFDVSESSLSRRRASPVRLPDPGGRVLGTRKVRPEGPPPLAAESSQAVSLSEDVVLGETRVSQDGTALETGTAAPDSFQGCK